MFPYMRLDKYLAFLRRETAGKEYQGGFKDPIPVFFHRIFHSDGVVINDTEDAVVFFHQVDPVAYSADIVTEMNFTCRLYTAKYPLHALLRENIALIYTKGRSNPSKKICVE
jgi:hypothetical protein